MIKTVQLSQLEFNKCVQELWKLKWSCSANFILQGSWWKRSRITQNNAISLLWDVHAKLKLSCVCYVTETAPFPSRHAFLLDERKCDKSIAHMHPKGVLCPQKKWSQANIFTQQLTLSKLQRVKNSKSQMIFTLILRSRPSAFITHFTAKKSISYGSGFHFTSLFFFFFRLKPKITYKRNSVITLTEVNWYLIRRFTPEESVSPKAWL